MTSRSFLRRLAPFAPLAMTLALAAPGGAPAWAQDTDPPVISVTESGGALADGSLFARAVTPEVSVTDASSVTTDLTLDGAEFTSGTQVAGDGLHELVVLATDAAGNSASVTVTFTIDTVAPTVGDLSPADGTVAASSQLTVTGTATGADAVTVDGVAASLDSGLFTAGPFPWTADGSRTVTIVATDAAGNTTTRALVLVRDTAAPHLGFGQPGDGALLGAASTDVSGTVADPHLEAITVSGTSAAVSGGSFLASGVPLAEGSNELVALATDGAGNSTEERRSVTRDTAAPTLAITDPAPGTVVPDSSLAVSGTVADPHLDRVEVAVGTEIVSATVDAGTWSASVSLAEGINDLTVSAVDRLGHEATETVAVERDSQAPEVRITAPVDGLWTSAATVTVAGTVDEEPGLAVTVNGQAAVLDGAGAFHAADVPLAEGENRLVARLTDGLGNQGVHTRLVYRDTVAPELVASDPADGALAIDPGAALRVTFSEPLAAAVTDGTGTGWAVESPPGTPVAATATLEGTDSQILVVRPDLSLASDADVVLRLTSGATDRAGNSLAEAPVELAFHTTDVTAPAAPVVSPAPADAVCAGTVTLAGSAEPEVVVAVAGGAGGVSTRAAADGSWSLTVELAADRRHRLEITARDAFDNVSAATVVEVTRDCAAPSVLSVRLVDDGAGAGDDEIVVTFSEAVDGASVAGAVSVEGSAGAVSGTVALSTAEVAGFTPAAALPSEELAVTVAATVTDLAGNPLGADHVSLVGGGVTASFLAGRVLDGATGRPLAGALATVDSTDGVVLPAPQPTVTTGAEGRFRLPVTTGTHSLVVARAGYVPAFRLVTASSGAGADVFDPRLAPLAPAGTLPAAGGSLEPADPTTGGPVVSVPAGALAADTEATVTALGEQSLPALLPYGWSPRGAVWLDLGGATLSAPGTLELPVDAPDGTSLAVARLDLATLQWQVEELVTVAAGRVVAALPTDGAWVAVEADTGTNPPPAPTVGAPLGASNAPLGTEVAAATVAFDPAVVLPSQTSRVTVSYQLDPAVTEVPSGFPVTLEVQEELVLLDGTVQRSAPYRADLVVYRADLGAPRSRFRLRPSAQAARSPLDMGAEDVAVFPYRGATVTGGVLGPTGGAVTSADGDRADLPAGSLGEPTAVALNRLAASALPLAVPAGLDFVGLLELDCAGCRFGAQVSLTFELGAAPAAGEDLLVLTPGALADGTLAWRVVALGAATATGWTTAAIDPADLPFEGVRAGGRYLFARSTGDFAYLRGTVRDPFGASVDDVVVAAETTGAGPVGWIARTVDVSADPEAPDSRYALPVPFGAAGELATALAENPATRNLGAGSQTLPAADARVDLALALQVTGPQVVEITPADGASEVIPGIEPTVRLSEAVDPSSLASGVQLLDAAGQPVPVSLRTAGPASTLVTMVPEATLAPGATYQVRVTTALRDLQGYQATALVTSGFTVREDDAQAAGIDPSRILLYAPDGSGDARIAGLGGAVPAGALVFVENTERLVSTPSVTAGPGGSFELLVEAVEGDLLLLHVLPDGANETILPLAVYLSADGRSATLGGPDGTAAGSFTTVDGLTVTVSEGTFDRPAVVTVTPGTVDDVSAPLPADFPLLRVYRLDLAAPTGEPLFANRRIDVSLERPAGVVSPPEQPLLLAREERALGGVWWMVHDLLTEEGGRLTTRPAEVASNVSGLVAVKSASGSTVEAKTYTPGQAYLPGSVGPGLYFVVDAAIALDFVAVPLASDFAVVVNQSVNGLIAKVDARLAELLAYDAVLLPNRAGSDVALEGWDAATGFRLFETTYPAPSGTGDVVLLPTPPVDDDHPPTPVAASPLRLVEIRVPEASGVGSRELLPGVELTLSGTSLAIAGQLRADQADLQVRLLGLDDEVEVTVRTGAGGSLSLSSPVVPGNRYLLALGARLPSGSLNTAVEIAWSEPLGGDLAAIDVLEVEGESSRSVSPRADRDPNNPARVRVLPAAGSWRAGKTYRLVLGPEVADAAGNPWGKTLEIELETEAATPLGTYGFQAVRDTARLGSLLFVAADTEGLAILDASDPADLRSVLEAGGQALTLPFPNDEPVMGLAVDPHGRVLVVGGGQGTFGQLKVFDPLALDPAAIAAAPGDLAVRTAAFRGSTLLSDPIDLDVASTSLPEGTPRWVTVLSDDQTDGWPFDPADAQAGVPSGIAASAAETAAGSGVWDLTLTGQHTAADPEVEIVPVTVRNLTRGRWERVDTDPAGAFSLTLRVQDGDRVELVRNRRTLAYVATRGLGIQTVDVSRFYGETADDPEAQTNLLGLYTGTEDPALEPCGEAISDLGAAILDLGLLTGSSPTVASLIGFQGLALFRDENASPGSLSFQSQLCLRLGGSPHVASFTVLEDFPVPGVPEPRDFLLVVHRTKGLLLVDVTDRSVPGLVGVIELPGPAARVSVDRARRLAYVAGTGGGVYTVDLTDPLGLARVDADGDGFDDRVIETLELPGNTNAPSLLLPELGLAFAGGLSENGEGGLTGVVVSEPRIVAVAAEGGAPGGSEGGLLAARPVSALAPHGVPADPAGERPGSVRFVASLPGIVGETVEVDVRSLAAGGSLMGGAGDPAQIDGLPPVELAGTDAVVLRRQAERPDEEGYRLYVSDPIALLAELRASSQYLRTPGERDVCTRCVLPDDLPEETVELLSGHRVEVSWSATTRAALEGIYGAGRLAASTLSLASVPWDLSPAVRQEPVQSSSRGVGEVAPGSVVLSSGEAVHGAVDLTVRGVGLDFAFTRHYRSQTVGSGPLGPGWTHGYRQRLRPLPDGDVEYFDGTGRREVFVLRADGSYEAPAGRFVTLEPSPAGGWTLTTPDYRRLRFDAGGRLAEIVDAVRLDEGTGNSLTFAYDAADRLVEVVDSLDRRYELSYDAAGRLAEIVGFDGRTVTYAYDASGRLESVTSPPVTVGEATHPNGLVTTYAYESVIGATLAARLTGRDQIASVTDPRGVTWLEWTTTDADGDGRAEEVTGETWGGDGLTIAYAFSGGVATSATVTDRRGETWVTAHDGSGHPTAVTDPASATTSLEYDSEGLVIRTVAPLGRVTETTYDTSADRRSRGNATRIEVIADSRGANGSSPTLVTTVVYDPRVNAPVSVTDPRGGVTAITRDRRGLATTVAQPEGAVRQMEHDDRGRPTQVTNPNGHVVRMAYHESGESAGYLARQTLDPGGLALTTRYETDARGNVTAVTDPNNARHEQVYDELDRLVSSTAAAGTLGYETTRVLDEIGQLVELREPFGTGGERLSTFWTYGDLGEVLTVEREEEAGGARISESTEYDTGRLPVRHVDPKGTVTAWTRDARGLPTTVVRGEGTGVAVTEGFAYDLEGALTTHTDGRGHPWVTLYDGYGRTAAAEDPLGNSTELDYDDGSQVTETRRLDAADLLLARTGAKYDFLGRPTETVQYLWDGDPATKTSLQEVKTTFGYDPAGNVTSVTDPLGRVSTFGYDAVERLVQQTDPAGNRMDLVLDALGRADRVDLTETLPDGGSTSTFVDHDYDPLGRRIATADALGNTTRWTLGAEGRAWLTTDAENHVTSRVYDGLGRLRSQTLPEGIAVEMGYDAHGNRTSYVDARGNATTWAYDALGRRTAVSYADGTGSSYGHDAAGNVVQITQASGTVVTQTHDPAHRLTGRSMALAGGVEGPTAETYTYDGLHRLLTAVSGSPIDPQGQVTAGYDYDSLSRTLSELQGGRTVSYTRDLAGTVTTLGYPSGRSVDRQMDALDRLQSITGVASYGYRGPDLVTEKNVGALTGSTTYDAARRPVEREATASGQQVFGETMGWSPRGLLTDHSRFVDGYGPTVLYGHDGAGRVTSRAEALAVVANPASLEKVASDVPFDLFEKAAAEVTSVEEYSYDAAQNLIAAADVAVGDPLEAAELPADSRNRPTSVDGVPLVWDAAGNLSQKGDLAFHYDYKNRLVRVSHVSDGSEVVRYGYDALNRKVSRTENGSTEETVWSGWRELETWTDGQLTERQVLGLGLDEILELERDLDGDGTLEASYTPVYTQDGNLDALFDHTGKPVERYDYSTYGERTVSTDLLPPAVMQLLYRSGALRVEVTEPVVPALFAPEAPVAIPPVRLTETATGTDIPFTVSFPAALGRYAHRRAVLTPTTEPAPGTEVILRIEPEAVQDRFFNRPAAAFEETFLWPSAETVLADTAAPQVEEVALRGGHLEVGLSEEVDLASAQAAMQVDGSAVTWEPTGDGYRLRTVDQAPSAAANLTVGTGLVDLAGTALASAETVDLTTPIRTADPAPASGPSGETGVFTISSVTGSPDAIYLDVTVGGVTESAVSGVGNAFGFHGRDADPATGLVYFRNRWYDPQLGHFVSPDPLGYVDGPSMYQFGRNNPVDGRDPLGLCDESSRWCWKYWKREVGNVGTAIGIMFEEGAEAIVGVPEATASWVEGDLTETGETWGRDFRDLQASNLTTENLEEVATAGPRRVEALNEVTQNTVDLGREAGGAGLRAWEAAGAGKAVAVFVRNGAKILVKEIPERQLQRHLDSGWEVADDAIAAKGAGYHVVPRATTAARARGGLDWSGIDPKGLTRREHVLRHGSDIPTRPQHGVFYDDPIQAAETAWARRSGATPRLEGGYEVWDIPMGQNVGAMGGQVGEAAFLPLQSVRVVVEPGTAKVITAYPIP